MPPITRPEPGVGTPVHEAPGETQYRKLVAGGFSPQEADQWAAQQNSKLQQAGFKPSEIADYWGHGTPHSPALAQHFSGNLIDNIQQDDKAKIASNPVEALAAGWNISVTGLVTSGRAPTHVMPQDAPLLNRVLAGVGQFAGDLPAAAVGFFGGAAGGAAAGGGAGVAAAAPTGETAAPVTVPVGVAVGGVVGAGFGTAAVPEATRQTLLAAYGARDGKIRTWQDAMHVFTHSLIETGKAGATGAIAAPVGGAVGGKLLAAGARPLIAGGADAVTNAVTATAVGGAMNGHVPDAKDFEAGAVIAGLFHTAGGIDSLRRNSGFLRVKKNLETVYEQTGIPPWEAAERAKRDPSFRDEVMGQDVNGEPVTPNFRNNAPAEPKPYHPAVREAGVMEEHQAGWRGESDMRNVTPAATPAAGGDRLGARVVPEQKSPAGDPNHEDAAWGNDARERFMTARRALDRTGGDHELAQAVADRAADELGVPRIEPGKRATVASAPSEGVPGNEMPGEKPASPEERVLTSKRKLNDLRADGKVGTPEWDRANAEFESARTQVLAARAPYQTGPKKLPNNAVFTAATVPEAMEHLASLERSRDDAVSPAGAIGKYQIMPGTARAYMGKDFDVRTLMDPAVNKQVAERIATDLFKRYNGNMEAIAAAYNAGPRRATQLLSAAPGERLRAVPDHTMRSGYRYLTERGPHEETGLPLETQRYLARARLFMSGHEQAGNDLVRFPDRENTMGDDAAAGGGGGGAKPPSTEIAAGGEDPESGARKWWGKQNEDTLTEEMLRNVGEQPGPKSIDLDRTLSQFVSELTPARRLDDRLIKAGEMDRTKDMGAEDMFRQTYASDARAGVFIRYGAIDPITLDIKPGSKSVLDAARAVKDAGGNMDGWKAYMLAMRTLDKQKQGIDTGFNDKAAAAWDQPKFHKKYQQATSIFNDVMTSALEYSRDSGVHSQGQIDAMVRDNPHYISMRRIMGDDESFTGSGRGFQSRDALKRMEGSDRQIIDPIMATLDNIRVMVKMADRNRAIGHVVGMVERGEVPSDMLKLEDSQTVQAADEKTFKPYGLPAEADPAATYGPLIAERGAKGLKDNQFLYFRNGKAEVWTAKDPLLAELMRKADSPGQANVVMNTFKWFAGLERAGIVISPEFPAKVQLRHQITAFITDPLHPPPFITWMRGITHVLKNDDLFQDAVAKGAMGVSLADMDAKWLARDMHAMFDETHTWGGVWNAVRHPLEFAQIVSERLDAGARVGYMLHAADKGVEPIKAATMSRKAYLDYAERGTAQIANWMAQTIPFFRPHLLGMKQGWEAFQERPMDTLKYATIGVAIPMATLYALNYLQDKELPDGQKWGDLPEWERDSYFITPEIGGVRLKLRTPPNVGFIFGGMVNRALDAMQKHDPHAFDGWVMNWLKEYVPPMMPTVVQAPVEAVTNYSFFTGKSLIPASMEKASGYMQYTPYTSETGKALSRALGPPGLDIAGMSPILFDHFITSWSGTVGQDVLKALDIPLGHVGKPWQVADTPFVGSFTVRNPGMSAAPIQQFYEQMDKLEAKSEDFKLAMHRAQGGSVNERDIEISAAAGQYAQAIAPIKQAISMQAAAIQGINDSKEMTPDEKRQATDELYPQLVATARQGLKAIDDIRGEDRAQQTDPDAAGSIPAATPFKAPQQAAQPLPGGNRGQAPVS